MPTWIIMPKLGVNMTKGVIVNWMVKEGDVVEKGRPILEVETDKVVQEVEAPETGVLAKIVAQPGETVPCTYVIAVITQEGEPIPTHIPVRDEFAVMPTANIEVTVDDEPALEAAPEPTSQLRGRVVISPAAKRLAQELGIDYTNIKGTGGGGRIQKADILAAAEAMKAAPARPSPPVSGPVAGEVVPITGVRALIQERMLQSVQRTARVVLMAEADATRLVAWREQLRRDYPERGGSIGYNELLILIVARALRASPYMNATLREDGLHLLDEINVGVAVDTERGLLVPVIKQADQKDVFQIHEEFIRLVKAARTGRAKPDDLSGGTFTITNLGMYEIDAFTPVINPPELAILGVGQIAAKPVVVDGQIAAQKRMALSLVFDHSLVDGGPAARFLQHVKRLIAAGPGDLASQPDHPARSG